MKTSLKEKREIEKFVDLVAINKLTSFYPSFIAKNIQVDIYKVVSVLDELVDEGALKKEYVLFNPENPNEKIVFDNLQSVKNHLYSFFDDFDFGESFYVEPDMIFMHYKIDDEYRNILIQEQAQSEKKLFRLLQK